MTRKWTLKKSSLLSELDECATRSPVLSVLVTQEFAHEVRTLVRYQRETLVKSRTGVIGLAGPVVVGIRYRERYLSEAPHPLEIATILAPLGVHHPNCSRTGFVCLGHPTPGLSMEQILHQIWAALTFNMRTINIRRGEVLNREAAQFVRHHPDRFPLTSKGLYEAEPMR
jgi:hypothetical protein